jgi:LPXTG-motif cell wall-anchored protein
VGQAIQALAGNPDHWSKTVMLLTWDDSGGFFDHVPPPVPSDPNEPGEHLRPGVTPPAGTDGGILSPIGLGFRVPMLVISPFSRNPLPRSDPNWKPMVCNQLFDHTSVLRFLKSLLVSKGHSPAAVDLPYDTDWRRNRAGGTGVGDLTSAFNFAGGNLPAPPLTYRSAADFAAVLNPITHPECVLSPTTELPTPALTAFPIPTVTTVPAQDRGSARRPSGIVGGQAACFPPIVATPGSGQLVGSGNHLPNTGADLPVAAAAVGAAAISVVAGWATRRSRSRRSAAKAATRPGELGS